MRDLYVTGGHALRGLREHTNTLTYDAHTKRWGRETPSTPRNRAKESGTRARRRQRAQKKSAEKLSKLRLKHVFAPPDMLYDPSLTPTNN